jgi:D-amino-acid oxidase
LFERFFDPPSPSRAPSKAGPAPAPAVHPPKKLGEPDFSLLRDDNPFVAGLRPVRQGGMRVGLSGSAVLNEAGKQVVHNYGHGGAGISLSFGAVERVREAVGQLMEKDPEANKTEIAVLGCGLPD